MFRFQLKFDERRFRNDLERAVGKVARKAVDERARTARCPEHGGVPTLERAADGTSWAARLCCEKQRAALRSAIGDRS